MDGGGFEPPKQFAADLQSVPFGHSGIHPYKADDRTRTPDLLITNQLLYQLSYTSVSTHPQRRLLYQMGLDLSTVFSKKGEKVFQ